MHKFQAATINEIAAEDSESIYVLNNSASSKRTQAGIIFLTVSNGNEGSQPVFVPNTWVPFDLTAQVEKAILLKSSDFRKSVNSRALLLVRSQEASDFLANDQDAAVEFDRANQDLLSNNNFAIEEEPRQIDNLRKNKSKLLQKIDKNAQNEEEQEIENAIPNDVSLKVQEILLNDEYSENERYSLIKNAHMTQNFTETDCQYILDNCNEDRTRAFVVNLMNKM